MRTVSPVPKQKAHRLRLLMHFTISSHPDDRTCYERMGVSLNTLVIPSSLFLYLSRLCSGRPQYKKGREDVEELLQFNIYIS